MCVVEIKAAAAAAEGGQQKKEDESQNLEETSSARAGGKASHDQLRNVQKKNTIQLEEEEEKDQMQKGKKRENCERTSRRETNTGLSRSQGAANSGVTHASCPPLTRLCTYTIKLVLSMSMGYTYHFQKAETFLTICVFMEVSSELVHKLKDAVTQISHTYQQEKLHKWSRDHHACKGMCNGMASFWLWTLIRHHTGMCMLSCFQLIREQQLTCGLLEWCCSSSRLARCPFSQMSMLTSLLPDALQLKPSADNGSHRMASSRHIYHG